MTTLDVLTFNLNNPGRERAERQMEFLAARPEAVLVLTETADSVGCDFLASRFTAAGYSVTFPRPGRGERGVMVVSRLATAPGPRVVDYLPHRAVPVIVETDDGPVSIVGLYVPSRDATQVKTKRKRAFLDACRRGLPTAIGRHEVVIGDFNLLEPDHWPAYRFFQMFEYDFYTWLGTARYRDAFRVLHPTEAEHSWVGRTGDGYRYDHAHVTHSLVPALRGCSYVHEVRTGPDRLTDHSALTMSLCLQPTRQLPVTDPMRAADAAPALF